MPEITPAQEVDLARRLRLYATLETARRAVCVYSRDPCDCKYGIQTEPRPGSEATGCCELRDLITEWTGWRPFHRGQSIENDLHHFEEEERNGRA